MRRLAAVAAAFVAAILLAAGLPVPAAHATDDGPSLVLSKTTAKLGESISVTGSGFPIGAQLQVEICGIGGTSNSCAIASAVGATADALGGFHQNLPVVEPPTPCPCTVHVTPFAGTAADPVDTPISIPGLRYLPQDAPTPAAGVAKLMAVGAVDDSPFLTQLGADGSARVTVTFANLGGGPAPDPGVVLTVSRGGKQVASCPLAWTGGALAVGARRVLTCELALPGGWFRDYEIGVAIGAAGHRATVRTLSAAVRPWGELVAPAALLVGVLCLFAARRRRYEPVRGLPVRPGAVAGRRSGAAVPEPFPGPFSEPFSAVEPATLGVVLPAPGLENATAETTGTAEA
ncbi:conserved hypothetical protein [Catenulispora acidiphila DSM 44928]|uniref:LPXTG-motif cell wall anchor domain protein n=1 Tax=Catenulispora acidiphila (strain DSM 44928 / JCM 14897 / NBRC 102108 / NRRL B-24433 / ID139908) TaxID=479433 RepID=C7Q298_CATAD|nr:hypothetical protein [Catenulispora acidiphila]ACU77635.1 conserved hypothetical protein [Catenulispora acidiphila DSM 44928]